MLLRSIDKFFSSEASGGILLMFAAVAAMIVANSGLASSYEAVLSSYFAVTINGEGLAKPVILWINDGLMAIFFLLVGLELKRELLDGKLRNPKDVALPGLAAVGGMIAPALFFLMLNNDNPATVHGWAIPAATDIAFALGVLALVGDRVPSSLKIFLLTLAILDDMGAILIIALFYTAELKIDYLFLALIPLVIMFWLNRRQTAWVGPILMLGMVMWFFVLKSGVHATLAGVLTAFFIPLRSKNGTSPLLMVEHAISPYTLYFIIPVFAFANAGVVLQGLSFSDLLAPLPLGIAGGLFIGKQVGVLGLTFLMVKLGFAQKPLGTNWLQIWGISCLAGIGFTMSLFIGSLSYEDAYLMNEVRLGVLGGSILSGIVGFLALKASVRKAPAPEAEQADKAAA